MQKSVKIIFACSVAVCCLFIDLYFTVSDLIHSIKKNGKPKYPDENKLI